MFQIYIRTLHAFINDVTTDMEIIEQLKLIESNNNMNFNLIVGNKTFSISQVINLLNSSKIIYNNEIENDILNLFSEIEKYYNYFGKQYFIN